MFTLVMISYLFYNNIHGVIRQLFFYYYDKEQFKDETYSSVCRDAKTLLIQIFASIRTKDSLEKHKGMSLNSKKQSLF